MRDPATGLRHAQAAFNRASLAHAPATALALAFLINGRPTEALEATGSARRNGADQATVVLLTALAGREAGLDTDSSAALSAARAFVAEQGSTDRVTQALLERAETDFGSGDP